MNLADLQIRAQVRTPWQALDLGVLMARRWFRPLWLAWLLPAGIVFTLLSLGFADDPWVVTLVIWWLKPLFERVPLLLLSRYLFNERSLKGLTWRQLVGTWLVGAPGALLWRRFDPRRSFLQAVTVLEKQKGRARSSRHRTLAYGSGKAASWLTIVLAHVEMLLMLAVPVTVLAMVGDFLELDLLWLFGSDAGVLAHLSNVLTLLCMSLVAPFYVACGFALYINRRIELEAWDLELLFRQLAQAREAPRTQPQAATLAGLVLAASLVLVGLGTAPVEAAEQMNIQTSPAAAQEAALELLSAPPYVIEEEVTEWRWKESTESSKSDADLSWLESWLDAQTSASDGVGEGVFRLLEVLLWIGAGVLLILLARSLWRHLGQPASQPPVLPAEASAPRVLMGLAIGADSLPADLNRAVHEALEAGDVRQAMSLLYRQALHQLVHRHRVPVEPWHTELECAAAARRHPDLAGSQLFEDLTRVWLHLAYAHQLPPRQRVEQLLQAVQREWA
ncbi:DUF4129 domain-containing protein [Marinobacterium weihaiense]|uniref:DUF4129 domain-containing protein n=1 Tax=Marinobacterium weihaiense TaxID=2851016 RepID=A0ABS6M7X3_9GAMM|nr:DUF4129 domain-containing protein [Marinobacterium weihaiense]MBV0932335.1 DUF4129 domain-containing protein [Marinobacterium weihaiense]